MRTTRLILGCITFVLFIIILVQSCAAGTVNSMTGNNDSGGSAGIAVAFISIIAGIIAIAARKYAVGSITTGIVYIIVALIGFSNSAVYTDLSVWAGLYTMFAIFFIVSGIIQLRS